MPKIEAEWQILADRIAQEVMELHIFVPLTGGREWHDNNSISRYGKVDAGHSHSELPAWQPHLRVAQAMSALEVLSQRGVKYSITRFAKSEITVRLWGYLEGKFSVRRRTGEVVWQTICLAIEAWLDAQKEKQDV